MGAGSIRRADAAERKQDKLLPIGEAFGPIAGLVPTPLGLDLYMWLVYRTFNLNAPLRLAWRQLYRQLAGRAAKGNVVPGEQITQSDR